MAKKATPTKEKFSNDPIEVEVLIPEEVLNNEAHLKDVYKEGKLRYDLGSEVPEKLKSDITEVIKTSKLNEIVAFNPLLVSLAQLESFKNLKWDEEKKNERDFIDSNKIIGTFNSSVKSTTEVLKKDATEYVKKVNSLRDYLLDEAKATRSILELNFKPYLDEKQRKKEEAEKKKQKELLEANEKLVKQNEEQAQKLMNQKRESLKLHVQGEIGKITFSTASGISVLNNEGLEKLKKEIEAKDFAQILSEETIKESGFSTEEVDQLKSEFNQAINSSLNVLSVALLSLEQDQEVKSLQTENQIMKAQQPSALLSDDNDMPFGPTASDIVSNENDSDMAKFERLASLISQFNNSLLEYNSLIADMTFEDKGISQVHDVIVKSSFPQILEWGAKLDKWTTDKKDKYKKHLQTV